MKKTDFLILAVIQLVVILLIAVHQTIPGNIDADYYFMGGVRLAQGHGFTENYIWNYFNDPVSLPQPSHGYWMPLASILTAMGMWLMGKQSFAAGRLVFILLAVAIPPLTAALAYRITARRPIAFIAGLLAICSGFYLPYLPVTENYGVFMVLGALYFLNADRANRWTYLLLGLLSGLMSLARSDGILWLFLTFAIVATRYWWDKKSRLSKPELVSSFINSCLALGGFLIVMLPWYLHNLSTIGTLMPASTRRALWLTEYYQTFIYPASRLTFATWLASGWNSILAVRFAALQRIVYNLIFVQGAILLLPFVLVGIWKLRADIRVKLGIVIWIMLVFVFTVIFPLASVRGTYIHSVAAIQPLFWVLASFGFEAFVQILRKLRTFELKGADLILQFVFVVLMVFISYSSVNALVLSNGWQRGELNYPKVEVFLEQHGIQASEPVMVINPPGYTMMTGRPAVMFPYGGEESILGVARQFGARYIVLKADPVNLNAHFNALYDNPELYSSIRYLGQVGVDRIFVVTNGSL